MTLAPLSSGIASDPAPSGPVPPKGSMGFPTKELRRDLEDARETLQAWFGARLPEKDDFRLTSINMPKGAGIANETLLMDAEWRENGVPRRGGYVVRVATVDGLFPVKKFADEYRVNRVLCQEPGLPVAKVVDLETDLSVLGEVFYGMERLSGRVCPDSPPFHGSGWVYDMTTAERERMWRAGVSTMARMNMLDIGKFEFLQNPGRGKTGWDQEFDYYCDYHDWGMFSTTNDIIDAAREWLIRNKPAETPTGFSWGDARFGNMMYDGADLTAVLDWDMASLAGGESDLAWWIISDLNATYAVGLDRLPGFGKPREAIALWESIVGRKARDLDFHLVFAAFRNSLITLRLAQMLKRDGRLPDNAEYLIKNNRGMQYLTTMLDLKPIGPLTIPWPGLDR